VDDLISEDVFMLMTGGIKEKHYTIDEKGAYKILDDELWQKDVQGFSGFHWNQQQLVKEEQSCKN
jgi:putative aldouronate transport system substrate-binding protein